MSVTGNPAAQGRLKVTLSNSGTGTVQLGATALLGDLLSAGTTKFVFNVPADTVAAEFAVESIWRWWQRMGRHAYPNATELLITADGGGSNGYRTRLWKLALQQLANDCGLKLTIAHYPPGTSKWNKIEHQLFSHITQNWRGRPLESLETVVNLIANTTTATGLRVQAAVDTRRYDKDIRVSDEELATVNLKPNRFHGDWNYAISPLPS